MKIKQILKSTKVYVENIHAPVLGQNYLSLDNLNGVQVYDDYLQCVKDCFSFDIPTMVIHLPDDSHTINNMGLERLERIIKHQM